MSSKERSDDHFIDLDWPTTREDIEALRRARSTVSPSFAATLTALSRLDLPVDPAESRCSRDSWEVFRLD